MRGKLEVRRGQRQYLIVGHLKLDSMQNSVHERKKKEADIVVGFRVVGRDGLKRMILPLLKLRGQSVFGWIPLRAESMGGAAQGRPKQTSHGKRGGSATNRPNVQSAGLRTKERIRAIMAKDLWEQ